MPITYDIQKDALFKQSLSLGETKGIQKGIQRVVHLCLKQGMNYEQIVPITGLTISQIKQIEAERID